MLVVATAGHVDHGKSALVRALTGMEPDRWSEERRRGLTIDLGYAWTEVGGGSAEATHEIAFVDVPGHQHFIGNMLAGLGPAPAVLFVVAADAGWSAQTAEHAAAISALGLHRAVVAVTRTDLADPGAVLADLASRLRGTGLEGATVVPVSVVTGQGLDALRAALLRLAGTVPPAPPAGPADLWVDRAFTVRGTGTVLTGTLATGRVAAGDELVLGTPGGHREATARTVQALGRDRPGVSAPARVAVNVRGVPRDAAGRGHRLSSDTLDLSTTADVRLTATAPDLPGTAHLHVGTAAREVRLRPLAAAHWRLSWGEPLPLRSGDHGLLRDPGRGLVLAGLTVLDPAPPDLHSRGDAPRRAQELAGEPTVLRRAGRLVDAARWRDAATALAAVTGPAVTGPAAPSTDLARRATGLREPGLFAALVAELGLQVRAGRVVRPGRPLLSVAQEVAVTRLREALDAHPFAAPTRDRLREAGLDHRALREAGAAGLLLVLGQDVVLAPAAPAQAVRRLATLDQPFTTSAARVALGTSRRVAVALLEHLDDTGTTVRVDAGSRRLARGPEA